jgi:CheY-like chemotaxis protein
VQELKLAQQILKGKHVLFVYDSPIKQEMVEEVIAAAKVKCHRHYVQNTGAAVVKMCEMAEAGQYPALIVCDYDFNDKLLRPEESTQPNGGVFYEDLRRGRYDALLQPKALHDELRRGGDEGVFFVAGR